MINNRVLRLTTTLLTLGFVQATVATAQTVSTAVSTDTTSRHTTLFTRADAALAAGFVGLTVAMFPIDKSVAQRLENEHSRTNRFLDRSATGFELISVPGAYVIGPAVYAFGRFAHHPDVEDLGWHATGAVVVATGVMGVLKGVAGRSRPYVTADRNPHDFRLGSGFFSSTRDAFPSGHVTVAFAAASSVTSEVQRLWPRRTWLVAPVMYGGATMVALSRMYHNKHWASDVVLGAGIGTFSGIKVVRYSHAHPHNMIDRVILNTSVAPNGTGGGVLAWSIPLSH